MTEQFFIVPGRPALFVDVGEAITVVPLTFGLDAARAAVGRLCGLAGNVQALRHQCLPRGSSKDCRRFGWGCA